VKKQKHEGSKMTLAEYVIFARYGEMTIERANRIKEAAIKIAGGSLDWKKGAGMRSDSRTPYVKPEIWEKAFKQAK
jgi:hypothetical protein